MATDLAGKIMSFDLLAVGIDLVDFGRGKVVGLPL